MASTYDIEGLQYQNQMVLPDYTGQLALNKTRNELYAYNLANVKTKYESLLDLSLSHPDTKKDLSSFMNEAEDKLKNMVGVDFSVGENQTAALGIFKPLSDQDNEDAKAIMNDHALTQNYESIINKIENSKIDNDGKSYNSDLEKVVKNQMLTYITGSKYDARQINLNMETYTPYYDVGKELTDLEKAFHSSDAEGKIEYDEAMRGSNGTPIPGYINNVKDGSVYSQRFLQYLQTHGSDKLKRQLEISGKAKYYDLMNSYDDSTEGRTALQERLDAYFNANKEAYVYSLKEAKDAAEKRLAALPIEPYTMHARNEMSDYIAKLQTNMNAAEEMTVTPEQIAKITDRKNWKTGETFFSQAYMNAELLDAANSFAHPDLAITTKEDKTYIDAQKIANSSKKGRGSSGSTDYDVNERYYHPMGSDPRETTEGSDEESGKSILEGDQKKAMDPISGARKDVFGLVIGNAGIADMQDLDKISFDDLLDRVSSPTTKDALTRLADYAVDNNARNKKWRVQHDVTTGTNAKYYIDSMIEVVSDPELLKGLESVVDSDGKHPYEENIGKARLKTQIGKNFHDQYMNRVIKAANTAGYQTLDQQGNVVPLVLPTDGSIQTLEDVKKFIKQSMVVKDDRGSWTNWFGILKGYGSKTGGESEADKRRMQEIEKEKEQEVYGKLYKRYYTLSPYHVSAGAYGELPIATDTKSRAARNELIQKYLLKGVTAPGTLNGELTGFFTGLIKQDNIGRVKETANGIRYYVSAPKNEKEEATIVGNFKSAMEDVKGLGEDPDDVKSVQDINRVLDKYYDTHGGIPTRAEEYDQQKYVSAESEGYKNTLSGYTASASFNYGNRSYGPGLKTPANTTDNGEVVISVSPLKESLYTPGNLNGTTMNLIINDGTSIYLTQRDATGRFIKDDTGISHPKLVLLTKNGKFTDEFIKGYPQEYAAVVEAMKSNNIEAVADVLYALNNNTFKYLNEENSKPKQ